MKIITKHGSKFQQFRCTNCYCEFLATVNEVYQVLSEPEQHYYTICPECYEVFVADVPVKEKLRLESYGGWYPSQIKHKHLSDLEALARKEWENR